MASQTNATLSKEADDGTQTSDKLDMPILKFGHHTGAIVIRPWQYSDAEHSHRLCNNDKIWINMSDAFPRPYTLDAAYAWITRCRSRQSWHSTAPPDGLEDSKQDSHLPSSWVFTVDGKLAGGVGLVFRTDVENRCAELGYWLGEPYWGQSLGTNVVGRFMDWAWETYPWILRFEARVFGWNTASQRVLLKIGFEKEGIRKAAVWKNGQVTDIVCFAKVRDTVQSVYKQAILSQ